MEVAASGIRSIGILTILIIYVKITIINISKLADEVHKWENIHD